MRSETGKGLLTFHYFTFSHGNVQIIISSRREDLSFDRHSSESLSQKLFCYLVVFGDAKNHRLTP